MPNEPDWSTQSARLKWARAAAHISSARGAAERFGWRFEKYKTHENGTRLKKGLSEDDARKYARAFGVDVSWLMTGTGLPKRSYLGKASGVATISGTIGAGAKVNIEDHNDAWDIEGIPKDIADTCELYEVTGTSMLPLFQKGDILAIERKYIPPSQLIGRLALVLLPNGDRLIKTIKRGTDGLYNLMSLNDADIDDVEIEKAGRLAWVKFGS